ncbi:DNA-binding MarR family transcriptional regulator [Scopulibacillus darangshiensis]|uniref:DNA-binding MarR family transcriptional regulator n=1 Tax=Scopulibacillus darangshiensis TaxID=442528 RepID=A0A4R2P6S4_9BACL|nr:MarR family transcriptional regulator [Scopulibacillus darangshiensis]TCP30610.1 DNA-binding MarR family transcriptional regulator [Scopulibacillus darangshiensis]
MENRDMMIFIELIRQVNKSVRKEWHFNLSGPQLSLLRILRYKGPQKMSELAEEIGISHSGATALADRMIKGGYVARDRSEKDRRVVNLAITDKGEALCEKFSKSRDVAVERFFGKLDAEETAELLRMCKKMLE